MDKELCLIDLLPPVRNKYAILFMESNHIVGSFKYNWRVLDLFKTEFEHLLLPGGSTIFDLDCLHHRRLKIIFQRFWKFQAKVIFSVWPLEVDKSSVFLAALYAVFWLVSFSSTYEFPSCF